MSRDIAAGAKTDVRRAELVGRLADTLLADGLAAASLRSLAKASGTSDRMLLYYFPTKEALMTAALVHLAGRLETALNAAAAPSRAPSDILFVRVGHHVMDEAFWPYMRLWLEIAARSAAGEAPYRDAARAIASGFLDWITRQLEAPADRHAAEAARLFAQVEGLVVLKAAGLDAACHAALGVKPANRRG